MFHLSKFLLKQPKQLQKLPFNNCNKILLKDTTKKKIIKMSPEDYALTTHFNVSPTIRQKISTFGYLFNFKDVPVIEPEGFTEHFTINFGPQHPAAHGVLRLILEMEGEFIIRAGINNNLYLLKQQY